MPPSIGRNPTSNDPILVVPRDPQAKQSTHRAAVSFGARRLKVSEFQKYDLEVKTKLLKAQRNAPIVKVRVSRSNPIREGLLPLRQGSYGGNAPANRFSIGRLFHRMFAWMFGDSSKGVQLSVQGPYAQTLREARNPRRSEGGGLGNVNMQPRSPEQTIQASDTDLARLLGYERRNSFNRFIGVGTEAYAVVDRRVGGVSDDGDSLFGGKAPRLSDIQQSDSRSTCHFLANLATILARPDGAQRIQNIMQDHGDGTVTVRFADRDVRVSRDRIVDQDGDDLFNVGAPWVRIMEKAYLGYLAGKHGETTNLGDVDGKAFRSQEQNFENRFDRSMPSVAQAALAHTLREDPSQCARIDNHGETSVEWDLKGFNPNQRGYTPERMHDVIRETLDGGGSVFAGVSGTSKWFRRMLPGHVYTILSVGERTTTSKGETKTEQGYWVFDPYGKSVGGVDPGDIEQNQQENESGVRLKDGTRGTNSRFFVTREQAAELFSTFNIAGRELPREVGGNDEIGIDEEFAEDEIDIIDEITDGAVSGDGIGVDVLVSEGVFTTGTFELPNYDRENVNETDRSSQVEESTTDNNIAIDDSWSMNGVTPGDELAERHFGVEPQQVKQDFCRAFNQALRQMSIRFQLEPDNLQFQVEQGRLHAYIQTAEILVDVAFLRDGLVHLSLAEVEEEAQGHGLASGMLGALLELSKKYPESVKSLSMLANISVGGYAWARAGFLPIDNATTRNVCQYAIQRLNAWLKQNPNDPVVPGLKSELERALRSHNPDPRIIRKIAALPQKVRFESEFQLPERSWGEEDEPKGQSTLGKSCLLGTEWLGTFDLQRDRKYLEAYVGMKQALPWNPISKSRSDYGREYEQMTWGNRN